MTAIDLPWLRRGRSHRGRLRAVPSAPCEPATPTHALSPRVEDLGGWWSACARRALALLPSDLQWARPLLDPVQPVPLLCSREQAERLLRWHARLPSYAQVSFTAAKRRRDGHPPLCA